MPRLLIALAFFSVTTTLSAQAPLTVGRAVRDTVSRGDTARYRIDADTGFIIRLTVDQLSANVRVRVLGPKGNALRNTNASPRGPERLQLETTEKGTHQVQVIPVDSAAGEYAITLVAQEPLSSDPKKLVDQLFAPWDRRDGPGAAVAV